jgi:hypothetical protein
MTSAKREPMVSVVFFVLRGGIVDVVSDMSTCMRRQKWWWWSFGSRSRDAENCFSGRILD